MVQFLSINFFFLDFFNFSWVFQKFPFFVSLCINTRGMPEWQEKKNIFVTVDLCRLCQQSVGLEEGW